MESSINHLPLNAKKTVRSLKCLFIEVLRWKRNHHTRRQLSELSEHMYKDLGLTKEQVSNEVKRSFWD
ncbi:hypothetical protein BOO29_18525 [Vibrio navarrensis]|uniref:YjiS-like domain-containing protein n=1 Tax=Vibrio navarrensis TaxID=29495 RepID=A0A099LLM6_9VIBR|nr:DUF1127 domain-containing protein [Vibrio navarrensis]KGK09070.1 hypothetical protein EA26_17760 [Vibrio navarrensis]MBE3663651.1 hypothetical protein [Vibrio navarrensis]MBE4586897.1 hypothetical protein [Vibrio navarrensis]MBE4598791.1 hypothetical protein [Vibrio navarrensis]MBE4614080.1 hypothetical protein [Vibrio navarrensis]